MGNKTRWIGLLILIVVIAAGGIYLLLGGGQEPVTLRGYVGGEKIGLLEDSVCRRPWSGSTRSLWTMPEPDPWTW